MTFFFKLQPDTIFERDIAIQDLAVGFTPPTTQTLSWPGNQPQITPKTGKIQASADTGIIFVELAVTGIGSATDRSNVKLFASDTVDTADGTVLFDFGIVNGGVTETIPLTVILPKNKFLTVETTINLNSPSFTIKSALVIERGELTRDLDPLLQ